MRCSNYCTGQWTVGIMCDWLCCVFPREYGKFYTINIHLSYLILSHTSLYHSPCRLALKQWYHSIFLGFWGERGAGCPLSVKTLLCTYRTTLGWSSSKLTHIRAKSIGGKHFVVEKLRGQFGLWKFFNAKIFLRKSYYTKISRFTVL